MLGGKKVTCFYTVLLRGTPLRRRLTIGCVKQSQYRKLSACSGLSDMSYGA